MSAACPIFEVNRVSNLKQFDTAQSEGDLIVIRFWKKPDHVLLDGDWVKTRWSLTRASADEIFSYCSDKVLSIGGGETCLRIKVKPAL